MIAKTTEYYPTVVLSMGRRWGKTVLGGVLSLATAVRGGRVAWVVPAYKNGRPLWRWAEAATRTLKIAGEAVVNRHERTVEFPRSGGFLGIYSADDEGDAIRGEAFHLVIMDEAARVPEITWTDSIQPTLADYGGHALLISTPRGRNWFWREWMRGQDETQDEVRSFKAPSRDNPNPRIQHASDLAQERVPERSYQQEWRAEFVDDGGGVFRNVDACLYGPLDPNAQPKLPVTYRYVMGVDLAKHNDFTVCVVADVLEKRIVAFDRWNKADWPMQKARIALLAKRWNDALLILDSTGLGDVVYDDLRMAGLRVQPYTFTATSKEQLVNHAVLLVEQKQVAIPSVPVLCNEVKSLEYQQSKASGRYRISAPEGMHDDAAMAFCLCCWGLGHGAAGSMSGTAMDMLLSGGIAISDVGGLGHKAKRF